jgi:pyruvate dehydrogenase E2 component (dihydrolipoamide acetyltransferase)
VDIETDKATMAFEAEATGRLRLRAAVGDAVPVGDPIAAIELDNTSDVSAPAAAPKPPRPGSRPSASPGVPPESMPPGPRADEPPATRAAPAPERPSRRSGGALNASPLARRVARARGIDLAGLAGSGPHARILKRDVVGVATSAHGVASASRPAAAAPLIVLEIEVAFSRAVELCEQLRNALAPAPTLQDIVTAATALTLRDHPWLNSAWLEAGVVHRERVDLGFTIPIDGALVTPTLAGAQTLSLAVLAERSAGLLQRAKAGTLGGEDLLPATFTITNLGMFGTARLSVPLGIGQAASIGVGAFPSVQRRQADGRRALVASLTLVCDQRVVHVGQAASFLEALAELLEAPMRILL